MANDIIGKLINGRPLCAKALADKAYGGVAIAVETIEPYIASQTISFKIGNKEYHGKTLVEAAIICLKHYYSK